MHVQFEFTQEDMVDVARRGLSRSQAAKAWRRRGLLYSLALSWLLTFLLF